MKKHLPVILNSSLLGEQGVVAVQKIAPRIGFIFRDMTKNDFGIDAYFERFHPTDNPTKHHMTGRLLAVQIKCGDFVVRDGGDEYKLSCTEANVNYWKGHSLPVVVIYCRPQDEKCFWVVVNDSSLSKAKVNWILRIPKKNDLENSNAPLIKLADGFAAACELPAKHDFVFEFDEHDGLLPQDDEEVGVLCSEFIAHLRSGENLTASIFIKNEDIVKSKLDAFSNASSLSLSERKEKLDWHEIDRRYRKKKSALTEGLLAMLSSEQIGRTYFWQMDHAAKGRAIRNLFSMYTLNFWGVGGVMSLDAFPNRAPFEPCVKISLSQHERDQFLESTGIKDIQVQLMAHWGYIALDLPRHVFNEKLLPGVVFKCQVHAELKSISLDEYMAQLNIPIDGWVIGLS